MGVTAHGTHSHQAQSSRMPTATPTSQTATTISSPIAPPTQTPTQPTTPTTTTLTTTTQTPTAKSTAPTSTIPTRAKPNGPRTTQTAGWTPPTTNGQMAKAPRTLPPAAQAPHNSPLATPFTLPA